MKDKFYKPDWTEEDCIEKCVNYKSRETCFHCKRPYNPIYGDLFGSNGVKYNEDNFKETN